MAAFTVASAEARVKAKGPAGDRTWVNAFSGYANMTATPCVTVQRYLAPGAVAGGAWVELMDDGAV
jgi:hypothetical protein